MWNFWITVFGICFIFLMTTLGSAVVYFFKKEISPKVNALFLGFASGVMIAASVWSLLLPALAQAQERWGTWSFFPAAVGIVCGGVLLVGLDEIAPRICSAKGKELLERNMGAEWKKSVRLFLAVTLHNIPEGLAVGFAFGAASRIATTAAFLSALGLAVGIGLQNFPEGAAISLPMKNALKSPNIAFLWGMGSGLPEPIFAILGYFLATSLQILQPWLLSFAAGAMLFVAAEDLIPDARLEEKPKLGAWGVLLGFVTMMTLDVAFG